MVGSQHPKPIAAVAAASTTVATDTTVTSSVSSVVASIVTPTTIAATGSAAVDRGDSPLRGVTSSGCGRASDPGNGAVGHDHAGVNGLISPAILSHLYGQRSVSLPSVLLGDPSATRTMQNDEEFNIRFVNLVRKYKCLYDRKVPEYRNRDNQEKAWLNISIETKESGNII